MYSVLIWGTGDWGEKCFQDILPEVKVECFVESVAKKESFHGKRVISGWELAGGYAYDYLILANTHEEEIISDFGLDRERVVLYRQRPYRIGAVLFRYQILNLARGIMPYISVTSDGLKFLFNKTDILIPDAMQFYEATWSKAEMEFFYREAPKVAGGIFMDIGANIGTTSIYFRKRLAPRLRYIAFEPVQENYRVLRMNCILNDCEDIIVENIGVSDADGEKELVIVEENYGGCVVGSHGEKTETGRFTALDGYVRKKGISPGDISYIWMDIEGHEAEAVSGGRRTLMESGASLFMEFNAGAYRDGGKLEGIVRGLQGIYSSFICYEQYAAGRTGKRNITDLGGLAAEVCYRQCNVLFIK